MFFKLFSAILISFLLLVLASQAMAEILEVRLKNITHQVFSSPLVATGPCTAGVFSLGNPASVAVEQMAEGGSTSALAQWFLNRGWVTNSPGTPVYPGQVRTTMLTVPVVVPPSNLCMFVGGMLVQTNDGFFAIQGLPVRSYLARTVYLPAYDSGTECNSERCADLPPGSIAECGPGGIGFTPFGCPHEGFITSHAGIHGYEDSQIDPKVNNFTSDKVGWIYMLLR